MCFDWNFQYIISLHCFNSIPCTLKTYLPSSRAKTISLRAIRLARPPTLPFCLPIMDQMLKVSSYLPFKVQEGDISASNWTKTARTSAFWSHILPVKAQNRYLSALIFSTWLTSPFSWSQETRSLPWQATKPTRMMLRTTSGHPWASRTSKSKPSPQTAMILSVRASTLSHTTKVILGFVYLNYRRPQSQTLKFPIKAMSVRRNRASKSLKKKVHPPQPPLAAKVRHLGLHWTCQWTLRSSPSSWSRDKTATVLLTSVSKAC